MWGTEHWRTTMKGDFFYIILSFQHQIGRARKRQQPSQREREEHHPGTKLLDDCPVFPRSPNSTTNDALTKPGPGSFQWCYAAGYGESQARVIVALHMLDRRDSACLSCCCDRGAVSYQPINSRSGRKTALLGSFWKNQVCCGKTGKKEKEPTVCDVVVKARTWLHESVPPTSPLSHHHHTHACTYIFCFTSCGRLVLLLHRVRT